MTVTVRLFAILRERAGVGVVQLQLPESATVQAASQLLAERYPSLADFLPRVAFAANQQYVRTDAPLFDGDELAVIPPVSGG